MDRRRLALGRNAQASRKMQGGSGPSLGGVLSIALLSADRCFRRLYSMSKPGRVVGRRARGNLLV